MLSETIIVSGFEIDTINRRSRAIRQRLRRAGVPADTLQVRSFRAYKYAKACREAAQSFADEFDFVFPPAMQSKSPIRAARPDMDPKESRHTQQLLSLVRGDSNNDNLECAADPALRERAMGSMAYMLATCPRLRRKVQDCAHTTEWSEETTGQLVAALRYYANRELAAIKDCIYVPAVARAELVRDYTQLLSRRLSAVVTEAASKLMPRSLKVPGISGALLIRSKGDPEGVVQEALSLRNTASELREYLAEKLCGLDPDRPAWHHEVNVQIGKLAGALEAELGADKAPRLRDAIQIHVGPPFLSLDIAKLARWREFQRLRQHITVLTEVSKTLAYNNTESAALQRLVDTCTKGTRPETSAHDV